MIDGIKIALPEKYQDRFLLNPELKHKSLIDTETGELIYEFEPYYGMNISFAKRCVLIKGSLHKCFNISEGNGDQNYDDFNYEELDYVIDFLSHNLRFSPHEAVIQTLEFGVNIRLSKVPSDFLEKDLVLMKERKPVSTAKLDNKGYYTEFAFNQYVIKIYDKGRQYKRQQNILRVELKATRSQLILLQMQQKLASTFQKNRKLLLGDLRDKYVLRVLGIMLKDRLNWMLIVDDFDIKSVANKRDKTFLLEGTNPNYWIKLKSKVKPDAFRGRRRMFKALLEEYGLNSLHKEIVVKVVDKWDELATAGSTVFTL